MNLRVKQFSKNPYALLGIFAVVLVAIGLVTRAQNQLVPAHMQFIWQCGTGLMLLTAVGYQWWLMRKRWIGTMTRFDIVTHRWTGVLATFLFALHATRIGHTWMLATTIVFILIALTGVLNKEILHLKERWMYLLWLTLHISLSVIFAPLVAVHIWVALAYQ